MRIKKLCLIIFLLAANQVIHAQLSSGTTITGSGISYGVVESTSDNIAAFDFKSNGKMWEWSKRSSAEKDAFCLFYYNGANWIFPTYFTVTTDGNVGIGTPTPPQGYKLAVTGKAIFEQVTVKQQKDWPDHVFYPGYRLRPLSEVEQYIQQNQHLPEVPSADEVAKNGLNLGENQATLLKKIEELTLYLIEQHKEIAKKNTEVAELKQQLQQVLQRLEKLESR